MPHFHSYLFEYQPGPLAAWFFTALMFVLYFLPSVIAVLRRHPNPVALIVVNLVFGWTMLGWFICLIWSFASAPQVTVQTHHRPSVADELDKLAALRDRGVLTDEEFERRKKRLLDEE